MDLYAHLLQHICLFQGLSPAQHGVSDQRVGRVDRGCRRALSVVTCRWNWNARDLYREIVASHERLMWVAEFASTLEAWQDCLGAAREIDAQVRKAFEIPSRQRPSPSALASSPGTLRNESAVAAKRRQQVAAVEPAVAASRLTVPPFLLSLG